MVPYDRFKEVIEENKKLKSQPKGQEKSSVDALEFIKLGKKLQDYSDEEIDFATNYAKSKSPQDILSALDNEMVQLAINAKREKVEKERLTLKPSGTQGDYEKPQNLEDQLENAQSNEEREKILEEIGLYKSPVRRDNVKDLRIRG